MSKIWIGVAAALVVGGGVLAAALLQPGDMPEAPPAAQSAAATSMAAPTPSAADPTGAAAVQPDDHVLGSAEAPVTIIEYASLTCPHCATFHQGTLPKLKSDYVDTGKVRFVYRDFPLDQVALRAAALAECAPRDRYFGLLEILFQSQANWATASDPLAALVRIGKLGGLSEEQVQACMNDEQRLDAVVAERLAGEEAFDIRSTPTFIVNGKKYSGTLTFEQMQDILRPLLP